MNKSKDKTPVFTTEHEERQFWEQNDSSEFFDWNKADLVSFPNLKPSTKTMSTPLH
ncbi:MAG: CopG family antitoxin [Atribacterota bacterium]|nr:CopG family antitoxin [Atribacterota bacterium]